MDDGGDDDDDDHARIQMGGGAGGPDPPEKSLKKGFLSNTGPDPLKKIKGTFKWRFAGGPMTVSL